MQSNTPEYTNFEIFYLQYHNSFNKPADSLVLFIHWYMIQNKFKCLIDSKLTETLPAQWNLCKEYYDFFYQRVDIKYRLEIYLIKNLVHIQLKRLSDSYDSLLNVQIGDYVSDNYKCDDFLSSFKNLGKFYSKVARCISYAKDANVQNAPLQIPTSLPVLSIDSASNSFTRTEMRVDSVESMSTCSKTSLKIKNTKNDSTVEIIYAFSPKKTSKTKEILAKVNVDNTAKTKEKEALHKKLQENLDCWQVNLEDCMQTMFKNFQFPVKLTHEMKDKLNLINNTVTTSSIQVKDKFVKKKYSRKKNVTARNVSNQKLDRFMGRVNNKEENNNTSNISYKRKRSISSDEIEELPRIDDPSIKIPARLTFINNSKTVTNSEVQISSPLSSVLNVFQANNNNTKNSNFIKNILSPISTVQSNIQNELQLIQNCNNGKTQVNDDNKSNKQKRNRAVRNKRNLNSSLDGIKWDVRSNLETKKRASALTATVRIKKVKI